MNSASVFSVTLTPELFERLRAESMELGVSMEWLVAALVADTLDDEALCVAAA